MISISSWSLLKIQLLASANHFSHNLSHLRLSSIGSNLYLLMAYLYRNVEAAEVGDDADAEYLDAAMACHDHLRNGAHTYGVTTQCTIHTVLCRSLEGRTLNAYIYTMLNRNTLLLGNFVGKITELLIVCLVHIREARTSREVLATQRMFWEEIDVVVDNHQITDLELRVHTARGIAYKEGLDAQLEHHALWEGYFLHVISLIEVESAFHRHDVLAAQLSEDELACMSFYGRYREVRDFTIWEFVTISYF